MQNSCKCGATVLAAFLAEPVVSPGAGSDHMSWYRAGYPAIFAAEGDPFKTFNPYIHTAGDKIDLADGEFSFEVRYFSLMYIAS